MKDAALVDCYIGLGGNYPNTLDVMRQVVFFLEQKKEIFHVKRSHIYKTSPVSQIPQAEYWNAVCRFATAYSLSDLCDYLTSLECAMGKAPKAKDAPRLIDLDLLFYGDMVSQTSAWTIPHPRWKERLFVLLPLRDVTDSLPIQGDISLHSLLSSFSDFNQKAHLQEEKWEIDYL